MLARGVEKQNSIMKTSDLRGKFKTDPFSRQELFNLINQK
jgi:GTP cyclohydrolase I